MKVLSGKQGFTTQGIRSISLPSRVGDGEEELSAFVDLDILRGWQEVRHEPLRAEHGLDALARLVHLDRDGTPLGRHPIHGPDVLVGRFHAQYAPVDVICTGLRDFENYKMGAPHLHLVCEEDSNWFVRPLSPLSHTWLNGTLIDHDQERRPLQSGDELRLGMTRFVFEQCLTTLDDWRTQRTRILKRASRAALFLMRHGAVCGPCFELDDSREATIGRTFPGPRKLPGIQHWPTYEPLDWDLAGLHDRERKFIAFRHVKVWFSSTGQWIVEPLSPRQSTFINRMAISGPTPLSSGDELGLGSMLMYFHHPSRTVPPRAKNVDVPPAVDWDDGRAPLPDANRGDR